MHVIQCFSCKDFGHIAWDCLKKFCNYCKKQGHIISTCPIRPKRKQGTAYHASISAFSSTKLPTASSVVPIPVTTVFANPNTLTPEMVQQMINLFLGSQVIIQFLLSHGVLTMELLTI